MTAEEIDRRGVELVARARELVNTAPAWADLSNALFDQGRGGVAMAFPNKADRAAFVLTAHYRVLKELIRQAQGRTGLVAGARPKAKA